MNVANQLAQVRLFLAEDRFIAILKQMAGSAVPAVEKDRISGQQPPHYGGDRRQTGLQQEVNMVGDQGPGVARCFRFRQDAGQPLEEVITIAVVAKYRASFDSPDDNVVQCTGGIYARLAWHMPS